MTRCILSSEIRLVKHGESYWANHSAISAEALEAHRSAFNTVVIAARCVNGDDVAGMFRVDVAGVEVLELEDYSGPRGMLLGIPRAIVAMSRMITVDALCVGRIPEPLSIALYISARRRRVRFLSILVSDPYQLGVSVSPGFIGRAVGRAMSDISRFIIRRSEGVVYVTRHWLQSRYPVPNAIPALSRSNVRLPPEAFVEEARTTARSRFRIVTIASLTSRTKGIDVSIEVLARLRQAGSPWHLTIVGGGRIREDLLELIRFHRLEDAVTFRGHLTHAKSVREELDRADIYLSTSRAEGLPRGMIEAMARALPVVATDAGGVAELVLPDLLIRVDDVESAVDRIMTLTANPELARQASSHSLQTSGEIAASTEASLLADFLLRVANGHSKGVGT